MFFNPFVSVEVACRYACTDHYICIMVLLTHHFLGNKRTEMKGKDILTGKKLPEAEAKVASEIMPVIIITCKQNLLWSNTDCITWHSHRLTFLQNQLIVLLTWFLIKSCRVHNMQYHYIQVL
jgi:hypothetical protein